MPDFAPEACHRALLDAAPLALTYAKHRGRPFEEWRADLSATARRLVGPDPEAASVRLRTEPPVGHPGYREIRFSYTAEPGAVVPGHLLVPEGASPDEPVPVVICLQGHTSGMHLSLGRALHDGDDAMLAGGRDFALQAVSHGLAALVIEQRCFGERADRRPHERHTFADGCHHASMVALLLGRTMVGERVWDVRRALDALPAFAEMGVDAARVAVMGNSGGGTIALWSAALDERISAVMPSCSVCTFRDSIGAIDHCADNYVPGVLTEFEMADLAGLVAPRPLVVVAGRSDPLFPVAAVERAAAAMAEIYEAVGASDRFRLAVGDGGHRFYPELGWPALRALTGW